MRLCLASPPLPALAMRWRSMRAGGLQMPPWPQVAGRATGRQGAAPAWGRDCQPGAGSRA